MTVSAQAGEIGFGLQNAKIGRDGTFTPADISYYRVRAPRINMGAQQDVQTLPPEIGGALGPTGVFKQLYFFAGDMDILPRLNTFGILLYGVLGKAATVTDEIIGGTANVGVNTHTFTIDATNPAAQPWMTFRRKTPGAITSENSGESGFDCKVANIRLTVPAMGKLAARVSILGRDFELGDASGWAWANTYEDAPLIAEAGSGSFKISGTEVPLTALVIDFANQLTGPREEAIIGDYRLDDITRLGYAVTLRAVYKYANDDLYRQILTGEVDGTTWTSLPFTTSGADAVEAYFEAPGAISGAATAAKYAMKISAQKVSWQVDGPPQLVGGGIVQLNLLGTVIQPDSGDYITVELQNDQEATMYAYADPSV